MKYKEYSFQQTIDIVEGLLKDRNFFKRFVSNYQNNSDKNFYTIEIAFKNNVKIEALVDLDLGRLNLTSPSSDWTIFGHDVDYVVNELFERFKKEYHDWYVMESL